MEVLVIEASTVAINFNPKIRSRQPRTRQGSKKVARH